MAILFAANQPKDRLLKASDISPVPATDQERASFLQERKPVIAVITAITKPTILSRWPLQCSGTSHPIRQLTGERLYALDL